MPAASTGTTRLGLGVIGAGRFAGFVAEAIADHPDVTVTAVTDIDPAAAQALAGRHHARAMDGVAELLGDPEVGAVVIATPPADHARLVREALAAGRHVFCEKPLATTSDEAYALAGAAADAGLVLVVDHVLRYNPVLRALTRLGSPLLGSVQRFCFENDASDEDLHPEHWFWDLERSGGIFVEHGVHFFDAAAMLLSRPATQVQATAAHRAGSASPDLVTATVAHGIDSLATHTHSFTHAHRCERQLMRLDYGAAEARVEGWIPLHADVDVWTDDAGAELAERLPEQDLLAVPGFRLPGTAEVNVQVSRNAGPPTARGRGRDLHIPHHVRLGLTLGPPTVKPLAYAESVRAAVTDLADSVRTGGHPASGGHQAADAVAVAEAATAAALSGGVVALADAGRTQLGIR